MTEMIIGAIEPILIIGICTIVYLRVLRPNMERNVEQRIELLNQQQQLELERARLVHKAELDKELQDHQQNIVKEQARFQAKEAQLEEEFAAQKAQRQEVEELLAQTRGHRDRQVAELERMAQLSRDEAKNELFKSLGQELKVMTEREIRAAEVVLQDRIKEMARLQILNATERSAVQYISEAMTTVVHLASEDLKGRLIGREGRNIRSFEQTTGVDLIIDDTPSVVVLSCFDPIRREIARKTLISLLEDGRIHPARIEELFEQLSAEMDQELLEAAQAAVDRAGVAPLPHQVLVVLGKLRFRASYGQNVLEHSVEVARIATTLANELGIDVEATKRAALLHDIGKGLTDEVEGPHALIGMELLRAAGEKEPVLNAVGAHHYEIEPETEVAQLVIIADSLSAARPGARRESLDQFLKRLSSLEAIANSFPGVEKSYAISAGREVRLLVRPEDVDDLGAVKLANEVARRIEQEVEFPGQIKVTVIRESRATQIAH